MMYLQQFQNQPKASSFYMKYKITDRYLCPARKPHLYTNVTHTLYIQTPDDVRTAHKSNSFHIKILKCTYYYVTYYSKPHKLADIIRPNADLHLPES